jgi:hypothetical protein
MAIITAQELKQKYPQYQDVPNEVLAEKVHAKDYADMSKKDFYQQFGADFSQSPEYKKLAKLTGVDRTAVSGIRDVVGGMAKGGENIARSVFGDQTAEGANLSSENANPLAEGIGRNLPAIAAGGTSIIGQGVTNALYGLTQHNDPNEPSFLGAGPKGRLANAIEDGLLAMLPGTVAKYGKPVVDYMRPISEMNQTLNKIGGGSDGFNSKAMFEQRSGTYKPSPATPALNSEQNIQALSDVVKPQYEKSLKEAVAPKNEIMPIYGDKPVVVKTPGVMEKKIVDGVEKEVRGKPTFSGEYFNIPKRKMPYGDRIAKADKAYSTNPSFENADKLSSEIYNKMKPLLQQNIERTISHEDGEILDQLIDRRNALLRDIHGVEGNPAKGIPDKPGFIDTLPKEAQAKYNEFRTKYNTHAKKYYETHGVIHQLAKGDLKNMTPARIRSAFSRPDLSPEKLQLLQDFGPKGIQHVLHNEMLQYSPKDVYQYADVVEGLEKKHGFGPYMNKEMIERAATMPKRNTISSGIAAALGAAPGYMVGSPGMSVIGGLMGSGVAGGKDLVRNLARIMGRK